MKEERVRFNGLAEFAHYYNSNNDMILDKIDRNLEETKHNFFKLKRQMSSGIKKNALAIVIVGAGVYLLNKKINKLEREIEELKDKQVVKEFMDDDVKIWGPDSMPKPEDDMK